MTSIIVSAEQAEIIRNSPTGVEFHGPNGEWLGVLTPLFTEEDLRLAKEAATSGSPRYTTAQVLAHLHSLQSSSVEIK